MARNGTKKMTSKYSNYIRVINRKRKLNKHISLNPNDIIAKKALKI